MEQTPRDYEQDLLAEFDYWKVYLHEDQAYLGRSVIALKRGAEDEEIDPFTDTNEVEQVELTIISRGLKIVLDELYQPTRLNYANLRNLWHHCHWHVVPRYEQPDAGLRVVDGFSFYDHNTGRNYAPYQKVAVPDEIFGRIRSDMKDKIAAVF